MSVTTVHGSVHVGITTSDVMMNIVAVPMLSVVSLMDCDSVLVMKVSKVTVKIVTVSFCIRTVKMFMMLVVHRMVFLLYYQLDGLDRHSMFTAKWIMAAVGQ